ncbi:hypothetical protein PBY51_008442 [Eleginops maclovinus]|uniref:Uncharacterized protein n=1 Tax=Eleginops maclovinus TaxID=56733 RepID=A0AAN7XB20_ELEMC|nr:hypothetical protein PBY51_008442 [Eleginops maclovinus]
MSLSASSSRSDRTTSPTVPRGLLQDSRRSGLQRGIVGAVVSSAGLSGCRTSCWLTTTQQKYCSLRNSSKDG